MSYLKNAWYMASWAQELGDKPIGKTLLNEPIVLFRTSSGTAQALSGRCPHRFAPLHMGEVIDDAIQCPYHGLRFGESGACVLNPHGDGVITPVLRVRAFPLVERHDALWIWMGDSERADPSTIIDISELMQGQRFATSYGYLHVRANYQLVVDNLLDLSHAQYLHPTLGTADGTREQKSDQVGNTVYSYNSIKDSSVTPFYRMQWGESCPERGDLRGHMRWDPPSILQLDTGMTGVGCPEEEGPSAPSIHLLTPETERTTHYFWSVSQNSNPDDAELTQAIYQGVERAFAEEDEPMITAVQEMMGTTDLMSLKPAMLRGDSAAIRARRVHQALMQEQLGSDSGAEEESHTSA